MSLSVIPLTILGQITGVSGSGDTVLYQVSFKSIDGTPLYGVTAVWTDEQAEIEALAAQKPYGVWINPIDGTFTVKFAGYTYVGSADLTDDNVLTGVTPIQFTSAEVSDRLLPEVTAEDDGKGLFVENGEWKIANVPYIQIHMPDIVYQKVRLSLGQYVTAVISNAGKICTLPDLVINYNDYADPEEQAIFKSYSIAVANAATTNSKTLVYMNQSIVTDKQSVTSGGSTVIGGSLSFSFDVITNSTRFIIMLMVRGFYNGNSVRIRTDVVYPVVLS